MIPHSRTANWEKRIMIGHSASVLFALATIAAAADMEVASLSHSQMAVGQKFEIQTADRVFRGQMMDRATGQCQLAMSTDGENFSPPRTVYLLGATAGRQAGQMLVLMHEIKLGMKMELGFGDLEQRHRHITGEVTAIKLDE
jgi:hypothetical protein